MKRTAIPLGVALLILVTGVALAGGTATIDRHAMAAGGGHAEAGVYTLDATSGQPLAGLDREADHELCTGFRCRAVSVPAPVYNYDTFLPMMVRDYP